ncbi:MAG: MurT ligase domain-containing protein [Acidimicrobiia bacterium]
MSTARTRLALSAGRAAGWASRVTRRGAGTQVSGRIMLGIEPELLSEVVADRRVVLVSATNGKTTTTRLLAEALKADGIAVATNHTGANMPAGIAAALAREPDTDVAVMEVDERWLPKVVDPLGAELLVLGNLTRDQLDRFGEVRAIAERWREVCTTHPDLRVIANASDPHVVWAAEPAAPTWIALGAPWRSDAATCPRCAALLTWSADRFDCPDCGFGQPETPNRLDGDVLVLGDERVPLHLNLPGTWNRMNAALALATAVLHFGVPIGRAVSGLARVEVVSGRFSLRRLPNGHDARVLLAKNPAGWTEVLRWLQGGDAGVVLAVNAHVADGRDPSWLWDVPYELLRGLPVAASGERALDVAVRLDYGGVACFVEPDPLAAAARLPGPEVDIIASYTQFTHLTRRSW